MKVIGVVVIQVLVGGIGHGIPLTPVTGGRCHAMSMVSSVTFGTLQRHLTIAVGVPPREIQGGRLQSHDHLPSQNR